MAKKKKNLKKALVNQMTAASAGPGGVGFGTKSKPRGFETAGSGAGDPGTGARKPIPKGSVAYGGRIYDARNLAGLANALNKNGVSLSKYVSKRPGVAAALGVKPGRIDSFVKARVLQNKLNKRRRGRGGY